jgi:hypothetical protein
MGELAEPALRKELAQKRSLEFRRRAEGILEWLEGQTLPAELLQSLRAVAVLEYLGTPEARQVLQALASGAAEARLTRAAVAALQRLERRPVRSP